MLFVILMEAFSRLADRASLAGLLSGFSVGWLGGESLFVPHLLFADNTLLFCETNRGSFSTCVPSLSGLRLFRG